jgi:hypothetical protein
MKRGRERERERGEEGEGEGEGRISEGNSKNIMNKCIQPTTC